MADLRTALTEAIEQHRPEPETENEIVASPEPESDEQKEEPSKEARARDEQGKFAPKESAKQEVNKETKTEIQNEISARPPRPNTWKKEYWESFDKLDPKLASYINEREQQIHTGIEQYREKAQLAQAYESVVTPYMDAIRSSGKTPIQKFSELLQAENMLQNGSPQQKMQMFQNLAQVYGVNLNQPQQQIQQQFDPSMVEQIVQTKLVEQNTQNQLNDFMANPPEYFNDVAQDMIQLLQADMANSYQDAYDKAVRLRPDIYEQVLAKQQAEGLAQKQAESNKAVKAAKSKAVSVKGSSTGTKAPAGNGSDRRSAIAEAIREASANRI